MNRGKIMLKKFFVSKLFGTFDNTICFNTSEKLTIVIGPNGCGKTTMLKMMDIVFSNQHAALLRYDFDFIEIEIDSDVLKIEKTYENKDVNSSDESVSGYILNFYINGIAVGEICDTPLNHLYIFVRHLPYYRRLGMDRIVNENTDKIYTHDDIPELIELHFEQLPESARNELIIPPLEVKELIDKIKISLISTDRLQTTFFDSRKRTVNSNPYIKTSVEIYSDELKTNIQNFLSKYANTAQKLDEKFPFEILSALKSFQEVSKEKIENQLKEIHNLRQNHIKTGILEENEQEYLTVNLDGIDNNTSAVLTVYYEHTEQKLRVLDELSGKIMLFMDIINSKLNSGKYIKISNVNGIECFNNQDKEIKLNFLSSGEQQELVLIYNLIFKTDENRLILIDEPELSLHVKWQRDFIDDLVRILQTSNAHALVATHSPQIINNHWDLTNDLGEVE